MPDNSSVSNYGEQTSLFDDELAAELKNEPVTLDEPIAMGKFPVGWSDIPFSALSTNRLECEKWVQNPEAPPSEQIVREEWQLRLTKTVPSPHYTLIGERRAQRVEPGERRKHKRYGPPLMVDVEVRIRYQNLIPRPIHVHAVMVLGSIWFQRYLDTGDRSPVITVTRRQVAEAAGAGNNKHFPSILEEAIEALKGVRIERVYLYQQGVSGVEPGPIADETIPLISKSSYDGVSYSDIRGGVNANGQRKRGGRARRITVTFADEFIRAVLDGHQLALPFDQHVRNIALEPLLKYKGWKQTFFTIMDQRLELQTTIAVPWESVWISCTACAPEFFLDPSFVKRRVYETRQLLKEWAEEGYIEWDPRMIYDHGEQPAGVYFLERAYDTIRPDSKDASRSGRTTVPRGNWIYVRRGPNYARGRPPVREELWREFLVNAGFGGRQVDEQLAIIGFDRIRASYHAMKHCLTSIGEHMGRVHGSRWFMISGIPQDQEDKRVRSGLTRVIHQQHQNDTPSVSSPLVQARARRLQSLGDKLKRKVPGDGDLWQAFEQLDVASFARPQKELSVVFHLYHRIADSALAHRGLSKKILHDRTARVYSDQAETVEKLLAECVDPAFQLAAEQLWFQHVQERVLKQFGDVYRDDALAQPEAEKMLQRLKLDYPEWAKTIGHYVFDVGENALWERHFAGILERRLLELHTEIELLGIQGSI